MLDDDILMSICYECYRRRLRENAKQKTKYYSYLKQKQEQEIKLLKQALLNAQLAAKEDKR